jgi:hypothetical protein
MKGKEMFKYNLGQTVFFMRENKVNTGTVRSRNFFDETSKDGTNTQVKYYVGGNWSYEANVFATFDSLAANLRENVQTA